MASGHADWRAPGTGAGGRTVAILILAAANGDVIASPGAGFRIVLYYGRSGAAAVVVRQHLAEVTAANVFVRDLFECDTPVNTSADIHWNGVPLGAGNKLRDINGGVNERIHNVVYSIEPI